MPHASLPSSLPIAATMDLQYRLPPFQQILFTPTIMISVVLLGIALVVLLYLSARARQKARVQSRREALGMAQRILLKRGGSEDDAQRMLFVFNEYPKLDPAAIVMMRDRFQAEMFPLLKTMFDTSFAERMEKIYFPPPSDTRRAIGHQAKSAKTLTEEKKAATAGQTPAAIWDLMDATLRPGVTTRLIFEDVEGGYECLVMGYDSQAINVTLPAHNDQLVASLRPGMKIEGSMESGPSLLAFTSSVIQAVAGSMPYCRIAAWKNAWEVRKRDSLRLPISLDIDFQHISTAQSASIKMSNLGKEIGSIRPGKLIDISLGGCSVETPSTTLFRDGDMIRFSKSLVSGNPPATLLGAVVNIDAIDPEENEGAKQRLHIQFLVIDDVSQRILVRTLRQLQDVAEREEWMKAQQLMQQMRRHKVENIGAPASPRRESTSYLGGAKAGGGSGTGRNAKGGSRPDSAGSTNHGAKPATRSLPKVPPGAQTQPRHSTRSLPKAPPAQRPPTRDKG